jgi:hypothetical protein
MIIIIHVFKNYYFHGQFTSKAEIFAQHDEIVGLAFPLQKFWAEAPH